MKYCRDKGYDWEGLYDLFKRVSCWCCPLQSLQDLRMLRKNFPELWLHLQNLDSRQCKPFKDRKTVEYLDKRFDLEDELTKRGHSITNRAFHTDLKRLLAGETTIEEIIEERERQPRP